MRTAILFLALSAVQTLGQSIGLEWDANSDNTSGYRVYGVTGGVTNLLAITSGIGTTASVNVNCPSDWSFSVSATYASGVESGKSDPLPVAARLNTAPAILAFDLLPAGNAFNLSVRVSLPIRPLYVTNFVYTLSQPNGTTVVQTRGTNNTCIFPGLTPGAYTFAARADNWCGAGQAASRPFQVTGQGQIPRNLRVP